MSYTKEQRRHNAFCEALKRYRLRFDLDASHRFYVTLGNEVRQSARVTIRDGLFMLEVFSPSNRRTPFIARGALDDAEDVAALIASWCRRARKGAIL